MKTIEEKDNRLEDIVMELAEAQMRTQVSVKTLSDDTVEFKNEMRDFKDEMRGDRKRQNEKWGELANKWGTVVEDVVAPNIPRIAREKFGWHDVEDFMIRRKVRNSKDPSKRREFDVIAVWGNQVIINETKSTPRMNYVDDFIEALQEIEDYLPEYTDKQIIPIFASLAIGEDTVNYLTKNRIYAMAMGDETMDLKNFQQVVDRRSIE